MAFEPIDVEEEEAQISQAGQGLQKKTKENVENDNEMS